MYDVDIPTHVITCLNGNLYIDQYEVPFPDRMTFDPDTHETVLRYHGTPGWIGIGAPE